MIEIKKQYLSPEIKVVKIDAQDIICTSMTSGPNEEYGTGSTSGWY